MTQSKPQNKPKHYLKSVTINVNGLVILLDLADQILPLVSNHEAVISNPKAALLVMILSALNIYFRKRTKDPITFKKNA